MVDIRIDAPDGEVEAWLARPADAQGDRPGVLLFMDAIGLRPQIHEMADRIAAWGYVVLAPNLFYRSGTADETSPRTDLRAPGAREEYLKDVQPRMRALTTDMSRADTTEYLAALRATSGVAASPIAVVGYCMGVRLALRAAGDHPDVVGAVGGFHGGGLVTEDADSPHHWLESTRASVLLRHADNDASMPPEHMDVVTAAAASAGVTLDQSFYPGAAHGYSMADTSVYNAEAAEQHYVDLRQHLDASLH